MYEVIRKGCTEDEVIDYVQAQYLDLCDISPEDWSVVRYGEHNEEKAVYTSTNPGKPHFLVIEAKEPLLDIIQGDRKRECERLGVGFKDQPHPMDP